MRCIQTLCAIATALCTAPVSGQPASAELRIDGRLDEPVWAQAQRFDEFLVTQPYTLETPLHATTAYLIGVPEGILVGFRAEHPQGTPRETERTARDAQTRGDRVNVYIDFDGTGTVGYNFMVALSGSVQDGTLTNERAFNSDWDGTWQHAVVDHGDHWTVEVLLPWGMVSMPDSERAKRQINVHFDRVIAVNQERSAWPAASFSRPRFVSEWASVEIDQYRGRSLSFTPYVSGLIDLIDQRSEGKLGFDLNYKPSGDLQLSATINPDFGQVEADELIVNFDAVEQFFSDRRPFFTENQGLFDVRTPDSGLLVYTRRIGGPSDVDPGATAVIDAALKLNARFANSDLGLITAFERDYADDIGGAYFVSRNRRSFGDVQLGHLTTYADRPALARTAQVHAFDGEWRPNAKWLVSAQVLASDIDQPERSRSGHGAWLRGFFLPTERVEHELELTHFTPGLDFNDLGFQRRSSLIELEYTYLLRNSDFAADDQRRQSIWRIEPQWRYNDSGTQLVPVVITSREASYQEGGYGYAEWIIYGPGADDLITRGNGDLQRQTRPWNVFVNRGFARRGRWQWEIGGGVNQFRAGPDGGNAFEAYIEAQYFASETLNLEFGVEASANNDWLIWTSGNRVSSFDQREAEVELELNWLPSDRHELRAKLQWLAIRARDSVSYRLDGAGKPQRVAETVDPIEINSLGLQLRYRWRLAPGSDFYAVYGRGGEESLDMDSERGFSELFADALSLRDADQLLFKLAWRF